MGRASGAGLMRRFRSDRGAVGIIVAILLASGVLLGVAALSVDVGQLTAEREQLMSAADGAAQTIAVNCAKNAAACSTAVGLDAVVAQAEAVANENGNDGRNDVTVVCGVGGALAPCDPNSEPVNLTACLNSPPTSVNYVEVHTATRTSDSSTLLPTAFAGTFVSGYHGATIGACSRVEWGTPRSGLSLTISLCEWSNATGNGTSFVSYPPNPPASAERIIYLHGQNASSCMNTPPSGFDAPGGFGWLDPDLGNTNCVTSIPADGTYPGNTGNSLTPDCQTALDAAVASKQPIVFPVYNGTKGNGANLTYSVAGMASFVVTGYYYPGKGTDKPSWLTGGDPCGGNDRCIYGFFTNALLDHGTIGSSTSHGAAIIYTVG